MPDNSDFNSNSYRADPTAAKKAASAKVAAAAAKAVAPAGPPKPADVKKVV